MNQSPTTTGRKPYLRRRFKLPAKLRMAAALIALPLGLVSLLPKAAFATEPTRRLNVKHSTVVVAPPHAPRSHPGQERAAAQREVMRYEEARRAAQRKRWSPTVETRTRQEAMT